MQVVTDSACASEAPAALWLQTARWKAKADAEVEKKRVSQCKAVTADDKMEAEKVRLTAREQAKDTVHVDHKRWAGCSESLNAVSS